ncbi:MAG TPA: putative toxin-antitoxin system toxin component, PIN family [Candidatus Binatia bacterium]|nr:putative toxin-antitoxin system toxin component, PIN family [Candidatus Binatia bacterium]
MRVFLDTNVLASAAATRGLCADVLREVLASHVLLISTQVLSELKRVLATKFGVPQELIDEFMALMRQDTVLAQPGQLPGLKIQDWDDLPILSAAISAGADVFVTGDKELLDIGQIENLAILSPRQFWESLRAKPRRGVRRGRSRRSR